MLELKQNSDRFDQLLDEALKSEPKDFLSGDFTDKLVKKADATNAWRSGVKEFGWMVGAVVLTLSILLGIVIFWEIERWEQVKVLFINHWPTILMATTLGIIILFYDRVLLRFFQRKFS